VTATPHTRASESKICRGQLNSQDREDRSLDLATHYLLPTPPPAPRLLHLSAWVPKAPPGTGLRTTPRGLASPSWQTVFLPGPQSPQVPGDSQVQAKKGGVELKAGFQLPGPPHLASASPFVLYSKSVGYSPASGRAEPPPCWATNSNSTRPGAPLCYPVSSIVHLVAVGLLAPAWTQHILDGPRRSKNHPSPRPPCPSGSQPGKPRAPQTSPIHPLSTPRRSQEALSSLTPPQLSQNRETRVRHRLGPPITRALLPAGEGSLLGPSLEIGWQRNKGSC
jgi:hypothetical protein